MNPKVSIVICSYNMRRELPRTIRSLSPIMQTGVRKSDYEVIVVDNGSTERFDEEECRKWDANLKVIALAPASPSPVNAVNRGIAEARSNLIGVLIDGARLVSPGIVWSAIHAGKLCERAIILTLGFHLGPKVQMESVLQGYDHEQEDQLLAQSGWTEDGYRLFDVSVLAGSSADGWFSPMNESNAIFMRRELWNELGGGFDERFQMPGGGLVNLDLLSRAVRLPEVVIITLLGEATFHQVHGGTATNATNNMCDRFLTEYRTIRGHSFQKPIYQSVYFGSVRNNVLRSIRKSAQLLCRDISDTPREAQSR